MINHQKTVATHRKLTAFQLAILRNISSWINAGKKTFKPFQVLTGPWVKGWVGAINKKEAHAQARQLLADLWTAGALKQEDGGEYSLI